MRRFPDSPTPFARNDSACNAKRRRQNAAIGGNTWLKRRRKFTRNFDQDGLISIGPERAGVSLTFAWNALDGLAYSSLSFASLFTFVPGLYHHFVRFRLVSQPNLVANGRHRIRFSRGSWHRKRRGMTPSFDPYSSSTRPRGTLVGSIEHHPLCLS